VSVRDILANLPDPYSTDPNPLAVLSLAYDGSSCWVQIESNTLRTTTGGGTGQDLLLSLRGLMLTDLITQINANAGYTATLLPSFTAALAGAGLPVVQIGAWSLLDTIQQVEVSPYLSMPQAALYALLEPANAILEDGAASVSAIGTRAQIGTAPDVWLDDWGDLYGVRRHTGESDTAFRLRLTLQLIAPRANNEAMRSILRQALALPDVTVDDDLVPATPADAAAQALGNPYQRLNPYAFFVTLYLAEFGGFSGSFADLGALVEAIKAWGTSYEPRLVGKNTETSATHHDNLTPWVDTLLYTDQLLATISDSSSDAIADVWYETPRQNQIPWLLTVKPLGAGNAGMWYPDNPVDDGNAKRVIGPTINVGDVRGLLLGKTKSSSNFVISITDNWVDGSDVDTYIESVPLNTFLDTFFDVLRNMEFVPKHNDAMLTDHASTLATETVTIGTRPLRALDLFSRTVSPAQNMGGNYEGTSGTYNSRLLARDDGRDIIQHIIEFYQDTRS